METTALIDARKALQPFLDVFKAAQAWSVASEYDKQDRKDDLEEACSKARQDLTQLALDAYLATITPPAKEGAA